MISIHALLKRATTTTDLGGKPLGISIHALLKRATLFHCLIFLFRHISIHALLKRATSSKVTYQIQSFISIHALLKRATKIIQKYKNVSINFNSRSPEESDALVSATKLQSNLFQFTLSWRERLTFFNWQKLF